MQPKPKLNNDFEAVINAIIAQMAVVEWGRSQGFTVTVAGKKTPVEFWHLHLANRAPSVIVLREMLFYILRFGLHVKQRDISAMYLSSDSRVAQVIKRFDGYNTHKIYSKRTIATKNILCQLKQQQRQAL